MSRTEDYYSTIENLAYEAIENGATNVDDIYAYVTQYFPHDSKTRVIVDEIANEYTIFDEQFHQVQINTSQW